MEISVVLALIASSVAVFSAANLGMGEEAIEESGGKSVISLELPSFIAVARGSEVSAMSAGTNFLEEEAGITAYANVMMDIDLDKAKEVYRTIEVEKENYNKNGTKNFGAHCSDVAGSSCRSTCERIQNSSKRRGYHL